MGLQQWTIPGLLPDVPALVRVLRDLQGKLGRTPTYGNSRIVASSTTVVDSDDLLLVATAGGAVTVTLPVAGTVLGRRFTIKKMDASANNCVITGNGSELVDAGDITFNTQYAAYTVQAVMTAAPATFNWVVVATA